MSGHNPADTNDTHIEGNVVYPNAEKLLRPQSIRGKSIIVAGIVVVLAAVLAVNFVMKAADGIYFSEVRKSTQIEQNMARTAAYDFPYMKDYIAWSNAQDVYNELAGQYTLVQLGVDDVTDSTFDAFKLPDDVSAEEGTVALKNGIGSMDILAASKVLNGGWRVTMDLTNYQDFRIRYADFQATTIEEAILNAVRNQGFDGEGCEMTKEGVDESGNTFKSGTIDIDDETYFWRVSAVKFNDAYSIKGMPDTAIYVGIRMTN